MSLWAMIELLQTPYCERVGSGPFDEPLNAISNLAFVIAAVLAARWMRAFSGISLATRFLPWSLVRNLVPVAVLFPLALIFRTVDMAVCSWISTGTHFLWHIIGAAAGFFVMRFVALIEVGCPHKDLI